jgi:hypothetical protein
VDEQRDVESLRQLLAGSTPDDFDTDEANAAISMALLE